jgi:PAS domain S-box-containing protein
MWRFAAASHAQRVSQVLALGAAYYLTGRLGLLLAIPPGFATAVWPPSGIAFAGLLYLGGGAWPGVWLGSLLVNFSTAYDASQPWTSLALVTIIASGSTIQAVAGAAFIRRFIGFPNPLVHPRDIALFMFLGGPAACLIAASIGVSALWYCGRIPTADVSFNWFNWWVGDAMGVLTLAALLLVWTPADDPRARHRRWPITAPVALAAALVVILFVYSSRREQARVAREFEQDGATVAAALDSRLQYSVEALLALRTLYSYAPVLGRDEFAQASQEFLSRRPEVQALSWNPRVLGTPHTGQISYPVEWIVPLTENHGALGFDSMTEPTRRATLEQACASGRMTASPLVTLAQNEHWRGSLVFLPVTLDSKALASAVSCHQNLRGMLVAVYRPDRLLQTSLDGRSLLDHRYQIVDDDAPPSSSVLYDTAEGSQPAPAAGPLPAYTAFLNLAGRRWRLRVLPTAHFMASRRSLQAWSVLAGGLLFTSALTGILLIVTGRTVLVERVVQERTDALREANLALRDVADHARERAEAAEQAASALWLSESRNRALFEQTSAGIVEVHVSGTLLRANQRFCDLVGRPLEELQQLQLSDITHPDDYEQDQLHVDQALRGALPARGWTKRYVRPDGAVVWVRVSGAIVHDVQGLPTYLVGVVQDVTEVVDAQRALVQSQSRLVSFVEHTPAAVAMLDRDLRYIAVSRRWREDYQLGVRDLTGLHHYDVFREIRNLPQWQAVHQRALAGAVERSEEDHFVRPDGRDEWLAWEVRPWYGSQGEVGGIIMMTEVITARKLAAQELVESQRRLRLALDNARQGLWDWNIETDEAVIDANGWSIMGHDPVERTGSVEAWRQAIHPDDRERVQQLLARSLEPGGGLFDVEYRSVRQDGVWIWVNTRGQVQARNADGAATRMMGTIQDVSARKRAEANFEALLEAAPDGMVILGIDGRITLVNVQTERLFGYDRDELLGKGIELLVPDRYQAAHAAHRQSYFGDPRARAMGEALELFGRRKDGSEFPVEVSLSPLQTESGLLVSAAVRDVTHRRQEQIALQRSEERLRLAVDNASLGLWEWDIASRRVTADASWYRIMGLEPAEGMDVAATWRDSIEPDDWRRVVEMLTSHLEPAGAPYDIDYRVRRQDGEWIWLNARGRIDRRDAQGRALHMIGTIQDVSERKQSEALIRASLEEKEVLLREIHHRVKNNLAVVSSLFYLQSIATSQPEVVRAFEEGRNRIRSMALVHEQLYRSDRLAAVDFVEYATSLADHLLRSYNRPDTRVRLTTTMAPLELSVDVAIPCGLVLNELFTNCLKHAFAGLSEGHIAIELTPVGDGRRHALRVIDNGVGMPEIDVAASHSLGLRLMRSLARQLDGTLTFERREPGTSATLTFTV